MTADRRETFEERRQRVLLDASGIERRAADRREADRLATLAAFEAAQRRAA